MTYLRPVPSTDRQQAFINMVLHYTVILMLVATLISTRFTTITNLPLIVLMLFAGTSLTYITMRRRQYQIAYTLLLLTLFLFVIVAALDRNGVANGIWVIITLPILLAAVFYRSGLIVMFITAAAISILLGFYVLQVSGVLDIEQGTFILEDRVVAIIVILIITAWIAYRSNRTLRQMVDLAQEREQMLNTRNQELEAIIASYERTQLQLEQTETNYQMLFDHVLLAATIVNREGIISVMNPYAAELLGTQPDTVVGAHVRDVLAPEAAQALEAQLEQVFESRQPLITEGRSQSVHGREYDYLRQILPLSDEVQHVLILVTDMTAMKAALHQEQEFARAQERLDFFTQFFAQVSHDLKTPLAVMKTATYLLKRLTDEENRKIKLADLDYQIGIIERYINDMLMISRLQHIPRIQRELLSLNVLLAEIVAELESKCEAREQTVTLDLHGDLPPVYADQDQLRRALLNLVENAINYTPTGGTITIRSTSDSDAIQLSISDTGIGIPEEDVQHIFDPFYRSSNAKSFSNTGTGLGLAIVQRIIDLHNGTISVQSEVQNGTTFSITLPRSGEHRVMEIA